MSIDPRNLARPDGLDLIPPGASLDAYRAVIAQPTSNPISFVELALNSLKIAIGSSFIAVLIGTSMGMSVLFPKQRAASVVNGDASEHSA